MIPPASASAATRMPAARSRAYRYDANAASAAAARRWKKLSARTSEPLRVEEIIAVMRTAGAGPDGVRLRALIVVLWRAGLRIGEALTLAETDLDAHRGAVLVRHGKGDKRRELGTDTWAWEQLEPWQQLRLGFPVGPLFCVIHGPTRRAQLGTGVRAPPTGPDRRRGRSAPAVRATSAPPRARDRDGARRDPAPDHPAPTRACPSRGHLDLSPRDRQC